MASLSTLEKDFIGAFIKTSIKHSVSKLIEDFKQSEKETIRDCANHLCQYISRCLEDELPTQKNLVSTFLEGLLNKSLHASLYSKKHKTLNECIHDAIDLDDNCDIYGKYKAISESDTLGMRSATKTVKKSTSRC